jgi:hypothetical protein
VKRTKSEWMAAAAMAMGPLAGSAAATPSTVRSRETMLEEGRYCDGDVAEATWVYDVLEQVTVRPEHRCRLPGDQGPGLPCRS